MLRCIPKGKVIAEMQSDWIGHVAGQLDDWVVALEWEADPNERESYRVYSIDDLWVTGGIVYVVLDEDDIAALVKSMYLPAPAPAEQV